MKNASRVCKGSTPKATTPQPLSGAAAKVRPWVRLYLYEAIERIAGAKLHLDDALTELEALHELIRHHPGLRKDAKGLSGAIALTQLLCESRSFSERENAVH